MLTRASVPISILLDGLSYIISISYRKYDCPRTGTKAVSTKENTHKILNSRTSSDVPAAPINTAEGGKASLQPKRTPVSEREIEAILVKQMQENVDQSVLI
ncbi:hypothetical protein EZV62_006160 [Acer yangbiense]|uniref:Uncharacterized protein n=1 Tax=Acer yangbiense TaxID=1000413 RepID=A0A5C7IPR0_9ROSI|nr:hypothetical protein EZV62_006160 [Acer yangbiense]